MYRTSKNWDLTTDFLKEENESLKREIEILKQALLEWASSDAVMSYHPSWSPTLQNTFKTPYSNYEVYSPVSMEGRYRGL